MDTSPSPVTVVIAAYNQAEFVQEAIESAWAQTLGRPQVVVVDDGSTDGTAEVVAGLDVEFVERANGGPSAARNDGLRLANREFVVFLDADDRLDARHNAACLSALRDHPEASYAYTQWRRFGASDDVSAHPPFDRRELLNRNYIHAAALLRRTALRQSAFDERLRWGMEDWDLYLTLLGDGRTGVLVDEPLLHYRQRDVGRTATLRSAPMKLHGVHLYLLMKHRRLYGRREFLRRLQTVLGWVRQDVRAMLVPLRSGGASARRPG